MTMKEAQDQLNLKSSYIPAGNSNRPGTKITPTYITIHNTDNDEPGANAEAHARYLKGADARKRKVSWHYTVDDAMVIKNLPTSEMGWHAHSGPGNRESVGIEICENRGIDQKAANHRAALLTAVLMRTLDIDLEHVVQHNHWYPAKDCPHLLRDTPGAWDAFVADAERCYNDIEG